MNDDKKPPPADNKLSFPSLDASPLWAADYRVSKDPEQEETPPLFIIRDKFPRVAKAIELMWGTPEMDTYFSRLVVNEQGRADREGFPKDVMAAILKLSADHVRRFKFVNQEQTVVGWRADPLGNNFK